MIKKISTKQLFQNRGNIINNNILNERVKKIVHNLDKPIIGSVYVYNSQVIKGIFKGKELDIWSWKNELLL